jgi:hypothetical protein
MSSYTLNKDQLKYLFAFLEESIQTLKFKIFGLFLIATISFLCLTYLFIISDSKILLTILSSEEIISCYIIYREILKSKHIISFDKYCIDKINNNKFTVEPYKENNEEEVD